MAASGHLACMWQKPAPRPLPCSGAPSSRYAAPPLPLAAPLSPNPHEGRRVLGSHRKAPRTSARQTVGVQSPSQRHWSESRCGHGCFPCRLGGQSAQASPAPGVARNPPWAWRRAAPVTAPLSLGPLPGSQISLLCVCVPFLTGHGSLDAGRTPAQEELTWLSADDPYLLSSARPYAK